MATPNFYAAVYAIIRNSEGKILFSQRKNTRFMDGKFQLPAGHMDGNESMFAAMIRELKEELDIDAEEKDMQVVHISHRMSQGQREYFDVYLEISDFTGIPVISEPEKCGALAYFDINDVDLHNFALYDIDVIRFIEKGVPFSDVDTR